MVYFAFSYISLLDLAAPSFFRVQPAALHLAGILLGKLVNGFTFIVSVLLTRRIGLEEFSGAVQTLRYVTSQDLGVAETESSILVILGLVANVAGYRLLLRVLIILLEE